MNPVPVPAACRVIKDVAIEPSLSRTRPMRDAETRPGSTRESGLQTAPTVVASPCLRACLSVAPTSVPVLFVLIDTVEPGGPEPIVRGLQFMEDHAKRFQYVNLPVWSHDRPPGSVRRTLLSVQLADDTSSPVRVVFADDAGGHRHLAELKREGQAWRVIVDKADAAFCQLPAPPPAAKDPPDFFFVGGAPKSGTTWVEKIINAHPLALCVGEGAFFANTRGEALCGFLAAGPWSFDAWTLPRSPEAFEADCYLAGRALYGFRSYARLWPGLAAIGDRSPKNALSYRTIGSMLGPCKFVHCVRHPLDVVVSRLYHERNLYVDGSAPLCRLDESQLARLNRKIEDQGDSLRLDIADRDLLDLFLDEWMQSNEQALACKATGDNAILFLKYEDLLLDTRRAIDEILRFLLGEPVGPGPVRDAIARLSSFKNLSGGRDPGAADSRSFFRKGVAGDYRGRFDPALVEYAWRKVGRLAESMGYRVDGRRRPIRLFARWRGVRVGAS
jgi:Sulfotransferase domain